MAYFRPGWGTGSGTRIGTSSGPGIRTSPGPSTGFITGPSPGPFCFQFLARTFKEYIVTIIATNALQSPDAKYINVRSQCYVHLQKKTNVIHAPEADLPPVDQLFWT